MTNTLNNLVMKSTIADFEVWRIAAVFGSVLAAMIAGKIGRMLLLSAGARMEDLKRPVLAATLRALGKSVGFVALAVGVRLGLAFLIMGGVEHAANTAANVLIVLAVAWLVYILVDAVEVWLCSLRTSNDSKMTAMLIPLVRKSLRVTIVILALLQIATLLSDKPVTSLLAGLGVGGLAIALAAQDTIKNFFGSILIFSDKPFEMGDRIVVDGHDGNVVEVGFRSTRIRTLEGNLVTIPNGELANKTLLNIGKRPHIRRLMNVTITYDTPPEKVQRAVDIIKELLKDHEGMAPDFPPRVIFNEFNAASPNILVLYWYHPPDFWAYMDFSEKLNMEILRRFNAEGIEFAFPTQTLYLAGDKKRPLAFDDMKQRQ